MCFGGKGVGVYWATGADQSALRSRKGIGSQLGKKSKHLKEEGKQEKGFLPAHTVREGVEAKG